MSTSDAAVEPASSYFTNPRGHRLHCVAWRTPSTPKALLFLVHGFGDHVERIASEAEPAQFVAQGIAVFGLSHQGHGRSEGTRCHTDSFDHFVEDLAAYVKQTHASYGANPPPTFLFGESMGGAIAILATMKGGPLHDTIAGNIFVAPMCQLSDDMMLPGCVVAMFKMLMKVGPKWKIVPTKNVLPLCFKDPAFLEKAMADPLSYKGKPRVRMAWECLEATRRVSEGLARVDLPFIVLHGEADRVTAAQASRDLHASASSTDKTIKIYDGMWHALLCEPDGGAERCLKDVHDWIHARTGPTPASASVPAPPSLAPSGTSRTSLI